MTSLGTDRRTLLRGYVSTTLTPSEMTVDYRCVNYVTSPGAPVFTRAQYVLEDGVRGMQQTASDPLMAMRRQAPSDEQIIADTLREETGGEQG